MNCPSCGQNNRESARFCDGCGGNLTSTPEHAPLLAVPSATSGGFVGRQREMRELKTCLDEALSGHGRLVMLAGEPGIGKTRTAHELAAHGEAEGARVLWGRCYQEEVEIPDLRLFQIHRVGRAFWSAIRRTPVPTSPSKKMG